MVTDNIEELIGIWSNPENDGQYTFKHLGKLKFISDEKIEAYNDADDKLATHYMILEVKEKWKDQKGLIYFDTIMNHQFDRTTFNLLRVNTEENTLEMMFSSIDIGNELKFDISAGFLDIPSYYIWYKQ